MDVLHNIINLFLLLAGIALILWGEELFKLLLSVSATKVINKVKKLLAFLISGLATALTGLIILWSLGIKDESICSVAGLILFAGGGSLSMRFYRYGSIASCLLGTQAIFIVMFSPYFKSYDELEITLDRILRVCSEHMGVYLFVITLFILFEIYSHRKKVIRESDDEQQLWDRLRFRKVVYLCAGLAVFSYFLRLISRGYTTIFEINIINWPIIAFVFFWFIKWLADKGYKYSFIHNDKWAKFFYLIAFGLIVLPIVSGLITFVICIFLPRAHSRFAFYPLPAFAFTFRSAFSIVTFSILAYDFLLKKQKVKFWEASPVKMEVNMSYLITGIIVGGLIGIIVGALVGVVGGLIYNSGSVNMYNRSYEVVGVGFWIGMIMGSIILAAIGGKVGLLLQSKKESK